MLSTFLLLPRRLFHLANQSNTFLLPPGPKPLPVLGNLLQLGHHPHHTLAEMALSYGPVMSVHLGAIPTVVVSSSAAAREMFKDHDAALAGRTIYEAMRFESTKQGSIVTAQLGAEWRMLRRLCTSGFFATARLDAMAGVCGRCVGRLVRPVADKRHVDLGRLLFLTAFNRTGNLVMLRDLLVSKEGNMLFYHAGRIMELVGKPNVADFVPALRRFDPQGIRKGMELHIQSSSDVVSGFLKERVERKEKEGSGEEKKKDLLDVLLDFEGYRYQNDFEHLARLVDRAAGEGGVVVFEHLARGGSGGHDDGRHSAEVDGHDRAVGEGHLGEGAVGMVAELEEVAEDGQGFVSGRKEEGVGLVCEVEETPWEK